jgi:methylated-DNA-[protein]-cysteine S-methyltransferase
MSRQAMKTSDDLIFKTPLGWIGICVTSRGLRHIVGPQAKHDMILEDLRFSNHPPSSKSEEKAVATYLSQSKHQLMEYCRGTRKTFDLLLDLEQGTLFQRRVWKETLKIPYRKTSTYLKIAVGLGNHSLSRAVGNALGANPLPLVIPCHRVISSRGTLGGYSGGLGVKRNLLGLEGIHYKKS